MTSFPKIKLAFVCSVILSLSSFLGTLSTPVYGPSQAQVLPANVAPNPPWIPSGPAMDTEVISIFSDATPQFSCVAASCGEDSLDLTDSPLTSALVDSSNPNSFVNNPNLLVTSQMVDHGYDQIAFNLANVFWGVDMNFGNDPNTGMHIRQGVAHLINKGLFTSQQGDVKGLALAVDNPVPSGSSFTQGNTKFTFTAPNSCLWDSSFPQSGAVCTQALGPPGGTAYNCNVGATCPTGTVIAGTNFAWQNPIGSPDFCAAATHFIAAFTAAGIGTLTKNANCVLQPPTGQATFPSAITSGTVNFFVRVDDHALFELGISMAQEICALWTGALSIGSGTGCNFPGTSTAALTVTTGVSTSFCGHPTIPTSGFPENRCWWISTDPVSNVFPIDRSLYFNYNSRFVSGVCTGLTFCITQPTGPCDPASVPTPAASDYIYLCNSSYDTASKAMEFSGDLPTAFSQATVAADSFGKGSYTIPVFTHIDQFAYVKNWQGIINGDGVGIPNFFTGLNAYTPTPATGLDGCSSASPLCIRQGFSQTTRSLSPYIATTRWDFYMLRNIFDAPLIENPLNNGQLIDWMTSSHATLSNGALEYGQCGSVQSPVQPCYPAGTMTTLRLNLRSDIFWQDGKQVTSYDIRFAYVTMVANGAFFGSSLAPMVCSSPTTATPCSDGVTATKKDQVDIHLSNIGPFTPFTVGTTFVFPGRYWSSKCPITTWDGDVAGGVPDTCMSVNATMAGFSLDPMANHVLIGSGPWECADVLGGTGLLGFGCSDTGTQNPPVDREYDLTRYGKGQIPGASAVGQYFRSSGTLALYLWAGAIGDGGQDATTGSAIGGCDTPGQPTPTLGATSGCGHWQQGIGQFTGLGPVTANQVSIFQRFKVFAWVPPFTWAVPQSPACIPPASGPISCTGPINPPSFMAVLPGITLYEGPNTFFSALTTGHDCTHSFNPTPPSGVTSGGYDC